MDYEAQPRFKLLGSYANHITINFGVDACGNLCYDWGADLKAIGHWHLMKQKGISHQLLRSALILLDFMMS